ncbi:MAG: carbohydrate kinase, thermoresistant glucokinase family [Acidimicrobiaceae bacterium]|nr:carbohydrate kinase, thermoresistant glucokinase family [Acidimicrobiaceae bacterium]
MSSPQSIVVMGLEGSGKSTIARALSERLGATYVDADWLHSPTNREKMALGRPLSDEDRRPWLRSVGQRLREEVDQGRRVVAACSALKRSYRNILREYVADIFFVFLDGPFEVVLSRIERRTHDFVPSSLLSSQYAILEPLEADERGVRVSVQQSPDEQLDEILANLPGA